MKEERFHQISAFAAARAVGNNANAAYAVYDDDKLQITRSVSIHNISEHRALLMAVWSAVRWCREHAPQWAVSVYVRDLRVANELTYAWCGMKMPKDFDDGDRITDIITDCCFISLVAFSTLPASEHSLVGRLTELESLLETNKQ